MTKENEYTPQRGERILVKQLLSADFSERIFSKMSSGFYECVNLDCEKSFKNGGAFSTRKWLMAQPIEQSKEIPFTPTVGKVCFMFDVDHEDEGGNYVFVAKSGDSFIGAGIDEYDDLLKDYKGFVELFDCASSAKKLTKEITFSEVAQKFDTTVDKLKIKGYVNEQDALKDVRQFVFPKSEGKVMISVFEIIGLT